jgi:hypothetical protein
MGKAGTYYDQRHNWALVRCYRFAITYQCRACKRRVSILTEEGIQRVVTRIGKVTQRVFVPKLIKQLFRPSAAWKYLLRRHDGRQGEAV